jgi:hypothetical protein
MDKPEPLAVGALLHERYRIEATVGGGGFARIYRVTDTRLGFERALKETLAPDAYMLRQSELEASLLINIRHPNLPGGYDYFVENGCSYIVMDYVHGLTLDQVLVDHLRRTGRPLPDAQAVELLIPICSAVQALHSAPIPIIHRDIKPQNIKLRADGVPVLIDLGIAKLYTGSSSTTAAALGVTPGYAPAEQYQAQGRTDARTDIYALGATLYYLVTGQIPLEAPGRVTGTLAPPRMLNPAVRPEVEAVILKAMEMRPEQRYASATALQMALQAAIALPPAPEPAEPIPPAMHTSPLPERSAPPGLAADRAALPAQPAIVCGVCDQPVIPSPEEAALSRAEPPTPRLVALPRARGPRPLAGGVLPVHMAPPGWAWGLVAILDSATLLALSRGFDKDAYLALWIIACSGYLLAAALCTWAAAILRVDEPRMSWWYLAGAMVLLAMVDAGNAIIFWFFRTSFTDWLRIENALYLIAFIPLATGLALFYLPAGGNIRQNWWRWGLALLVALAGAAILLRLPSQRSLLPGTICLPALALGALVLTVTRRPSWPQGVAIQATLGFGVLLVLLQFWLPGSLSHPILVSLFHYLLLPDLVFILAAAWQIDIARRIWHP